MTRHHPLARRMARIHTSVARIPADLAAHSVVYDTGIRTLAESAPCGKSRLAERSVGAMERTLQIRNLFGLVLRRGFGNQETFGRNLRWSHSSRMKMAT